MGRDSPPDREVLRDSVGGTIRFSYRNILELFFVSVGWFLAVLPVVTVGPATLGAYRAVHGLQDAGQVDPTDVFDCVRTQLVHATLLGLIPLVFWGITLIHAVQYLTSRSTVTLVLLLVTFYVGVYLAMVAVPAFVALSRGEHAYDAVRFGHDWVTSHLTLSLLTVLITGGLAVVCLVLSVAFPALFAGLAASFHVHVVDEFDVPAADSTERNEAQPQRTHV